MANNSILIQGLIELHLKGEGGEQAVASMKKIIDQAKQVQTATGGIGDNFSKATEKVGLFSSVLARAGVALGAAFAASKITSFLEQSYLGFARTERQALATENQIKALGQAAQGAGFRAFIAQLSETSGILDDDLVPAFQRAIGAFKDYGTAQEIVTMASKFAAAGVGDVRSNVDALARFFQTGMARGLAQFGIDIKGGENATLSLTEGLKLLKAQLDITGSGFTDAQSRVNKLANEMDHIRDVTGQFLDEAITKAFKFGEVLAEATTQLSLTKAQLQQRREAEKIQAEQIEQARVEAAAKSKEKISAAEKTFADKQAKLDAQAAEDKAKTALKAETERLEKVATLEEKSAEEILKQRAGFYEAGSKERIAIELKLNAMVEAAAIANAKAIGAKTLDIEKFFAGERGRIRATAAEPEAKRREREHEPVDATQPKASDFPGNTEADLKAVEDAVKLAQTETDRINDIKRQGTIAILEEMLELTVAGTQERIDAESALEIARINSWAAREKAAVLASTRDEKSKADEIAAINELKESKIRKSATVTHNLRKGQTEAEKAQALDATRAAIGGLSQLFHKNKTVAIGLAVIDTALAVMQIWRTYADVPYVAAALTVAALAVGAAQIASIQSTTEDGGGGIASAGTAAAPPASGPPPSQASFQGPTPPNESRTPPPEWVAPPATPPPPPPPTRGPRQESPPVSASVMEEPTEAKPVPVEVVTTPSAPAVIAPLPVEVESEPEPPKTVAPTVAAPVEVAPEPQPEPVQAATEAQIPPTTAPAAPPISVAAPLPVEVVTTPSAPATVFPLPVEIEAPSEPKTPTVAAAPEPKPTAPVASAAPTKPPPPPPSIAAPLPVEVVETLEPPPAPKPAPITSAPVFVAPRAVPEPPAPPAPRAPFLPPRPRVTSPVRAASAPITIASNREDLEQTAESAPGGALSIPAPSGDRFDRIAARQTIIHGSPVTIQIAKAFGDKRSMTRLTNEIERVMANNQSVLR